MGCARCILLRRCTQCSFTWHTMIQILIFLIDFRADAHFIRAHLAETTSAPLPLELRVLPQSSNRTPRRRCRWCPVRKKHPYQHPKFSKEGPTTTKGPLSNTIPSESTYETVHAPPATVFLQALHVQIPTLCLLTVVLPQKVHA